MDFRIFISYTLRDSEIDVGILSELKKQFNKVGFNFVYIDILDNKMMNHQEYVYENLDLASIVCLIETPKVRKSSWVNKEIDFAKNKSIPILNLKLSDVNEINECCLVNELHNNKIIKLLKNHSSKFL